MADGDSAYSRRRTIRNAKIFVFGKVCSAALNILWLGLLVRVLDLSNYAVYVAAVALIETGIALSSLGVEWLLLRFVPEYVVQGAQALLGRLLLQTLSIRFLGALLTAGIGLLILQCSGLPAQVASSGVGPLVALLLISEACMRLLRDQGLESMGQQGFTQACILLRTALLMAGVAWASHVGDAIDVKTLLKIEVMVSVLTLACSAIATLQVLRGLRRQGQTPASDWRPPVFRQALRMGWHNYASSLLSFCLSPQALVLMVASVASNAGTVAAFGFMIRVLEIMRGYLPAMMLMNVLRPRFVALYSQWGNLTAVAREAGLASRLSVLTVAPLVGVIALYGDALLSLASGGKIGSGGAVLAALTLTLMVRVHRQISVVLVNCVNLAHVLMVAALLALPVLPIAWWLASTDHTDWAVLSAVIWDECIWVVLMVAGLRKTGHDWTGDWLFMLKAAACALLSAALVRALPWVGDASGILAMLCGSVLLLACFVLLILGTRSFRWRDLEPLRR